jgi:hypothetical protein
MNEFNIDSKEELDKKGSASPLSAEDYIVKVAAIDLVQEPTFKNRMPDYTKPTWSFRLICLPYALKAGGTMTTLDKKEAIPLSKYIFRNVSPFSTGFQPDKVTPSLCRAMIAHMEGVDVTDRIKTPDFVLLSPENTVVEDKALRDKFISELKAGPETPREMLAQGYMGIPDLRCYKGRFISASIEVEMKGDKTSNKITRFTKLPASFKVDEVIEDKEVMDKFDKFYNEKILAKDADRKARFGKQTSPNSQSVVQGSGEVIKEDIPF